MMNRLRRVFSIFTKWWNSKRGYIASEVGAWCRVFIRGINRVARNIGRFMVIGSHNLCMVLWMAPGRGISV